MLARACLSFSRTTQIGAKHNRYRHEHPDNTSPIGFGFSLDKFHKKNTDFKGENCHFHTKIC
jgi:hypothetical protein